MGRIELQAESTQFVADGRDRWMETVEYQRVAREAEERVRRRFAAELADAGRLKRLRLELQIASEIRRELAKLAPEEANWFVVPQSPTR